MFHADGTSHCLWMNQEMCTVQEEERTVSSAEEKQAISVSFS